MSFMLSKPAGPEAAVVTLSKKLVRDPLPRLPQHALIEAY